MRARVAVEVRGGLGGLALINGGAAGREVKALGPSWPPELGPLVRLEKNNATPVMGPAVVAPAAPPVWPPPPVPPPRPPAASSPPTPSLALASRPLDEVALQARVNTKPSPRLDQLQGVGRILQSVPQGAGTA